MTLQVRAKTAAHDGEWSNVIQFGRSTLRYRYWYIDMDFFQNRLDLPVLTLVLMLQQLKVCNSL